MKKINNIIKNRFLEKNLKVRNKHNIKPYFFSIKKPNNLFYLYNLDNINYSIVREITDWKGDFECIKLAYYNSEGRLHRGNNYEGKSFPAELCYDKNSKLIIEKYYNKGIRHRSELDNDNLPSEIYYGNTDKEFNLYYYVNGRLHNSERPAIVRRSELDGKLIFENEYYLNGLRHRYTGEESQPAVERSDGTKNYYVNGLLHRDDCSTTKVPRPAVITNDGYVEYWKFGKQFHITLTEIKSNESSK